MFLSLADILAIRGYSSCHVPFAKLKTNVWTSFSPPRLMRSRVEVNNDTGVCAALGGAGKTSPAVGWLLCLPLWGPEMFEGANSPGERHRTYGLRPDRFAS